MTDRRIALLRRGFIWLAVVATLGLGALNLWYRDLLLNWQPAPPDAPWRAAAAIASGISLLVTGALLAMGRLRLGGLIGAISLVCWMVGFDLQVIGFSPSVGSLLGLAERGAMAIGFATLAVTARWDRALTAGFGACCVMFGISHFVYADFTAAMVPAWLPARLAIAYLTGAIHAGVGLALLLRWRPTEAGLVEAAMMASFVLLLHLPDAIGAPTDRMKLTILGIAILLTASAGLVATMPRLRR